MAEERVYTGPDSAPSDDEGRVASIGFDGVEVQVVESGSGETYFSIDPPNAQPTLHAGKQLTNKDVLEFVRANLSTIRDMRTDMLRRFEKSSSAACRYQTGEVAYIFGRPFMLRVLPLVQGGSMRKAARGRANTWVRTNTDVSLVELNVMSTGSYDQRKGTFINWASSILCRNAGNIYNLVASRIAEAYGEELPSSCKISHIRAAALRGNLVRLDAATHSLTLSEDLIPFPAVVLAYTLARAIANELVPDDAFDGDQEAVNARRRELIEAGCPGWEQARELLNDPDSIYRRQL